MKLTKLALLADCIERISDLTETDDVPAIVHSLTGLCWDEEEAGEIKLYCSEECDQ